MRDVPEERAVSMLLRAGHVRVSDIEIRDGELFLRLEARIDSSALTELIGQAQASLGIPAAAADAESALARGPEPTSHEPACGVVTEPATAPAPQAGTRPAPESGQGPASLPELEPEPEPGQEPEPLTEKESGPSPETGLGPAQSQPGGLQAEAVAEPGAGPDSEGGVFGEGEGDRNTAILVRQFLQKEAEAESDVAVDPAKRQRSRDRDTEMVFSGATAGPGALPRGQIDGSRYGEPEPDNEWSAVMAAEDGAPPLPPSDDSAMADSGAQSVQEALQELMAGETRIMDSRDLPPQPEPVRAGEGAEASASLENDELHAQEKSDRDSSKSGRRLSKAADHEAAKPAIHIRYTCPRCKTQGSQPGDRMGAIVTCRRCGKAMRLTMKR